MTYDPDRWKHVYAKYPWTRRFDKIDNAIRYPMLGLAVAVWAGAAFNYYGQRAYDAGYAAGRGAACEKPAPAASRPALSMRLASPAAKRF